MLKKILFIFSLTLIISCENKQEFSLLITPQNSRVMTADLLKKLIESNSNMKINIVEGDSCIANLLKIKDGKGDFALCDNSVDELEGINTLSLIFPKVLQIFYKRIKKFKSVKDYLQESTIFLSESGGSTGIFLKKLLIHFGIPESNLKISDNPWDEKINSFLAFGPLISRSQIEESFKDHKLLSFENDSKKLGFTEAHSFVMKNPKYSFFILPKNIYRPIENEPIVTLSSDEVLLGASSLSESVAQEISAIIDQNAIKLTKVNTLLKKNYINKILNKFLTFPLHSGSRKYYERDLPGFFERNVETFAFFLSAFVALISIMIAALNWNNRAKKDRVDVFFLEVNELAKKVSSISTEVDGEKLIEKIKTMQGNALQLLADEELLANESFVIFVELCNFTINDIRLKIGQIISS